MAQQKGSNVEILLGYEAVAYKTVAVDGFVLPLNSMGVRGSQALNTAQTLTGTRNPVAPFAGNRDVAGPIVIPADSVAMWYWLKAMFGDPATSGSDPYVHEFKIGTSQPSFSLEAAFTDLATDKYLRFLGCKVADWSMTIGGDGELVSTVNVLGASDSLESSAFDGSPTTVTLARLNNFEADISEGGSSLANATEVSFAVNFGLDPDNFVIGSSGVRGTIPEGMVGVSGTVKTLFEDDSLLTKAENSTESSLTIQVQDSDGDNLIIVFQELLYERNSVPVEGPQGLEVELNFQGYYVNGGEASAVVARVTNSEAHA